MVVLMYVVILVNNCVISFIYDVSFIMLYEHVHMEELGHYFYNTHYQCHRLFKYHGPTKYMILKFPNFQLEVEFRSSTRATPSRKCLNIGLRLSQ